MGGVGIGPLASGGEPAMRAGAVILPDPLIGAHLERELDIAAAPVRPAATPTMICGVAEPRAANIAGGGSKISGALTVSGRDIEVGRIG